MSIRMRTAALAVVAALLLAGCTTSDATSIADDLAASIDGARVETITSTDHQFGFAIDGDQPPNSAAIIYLPDVDCVEGMTCAALIRDGVPDLDNDKSQAGFELALNADKGGDPLRSIAYRDDTRLDLVGIDDNGTVARLLRAFNGDVIHT